MRTTLDIDEDVLFAAKDIARREKKSLGQVMSELARKAFEQSASAPRTAGVAEPLAEYGIHPLPARGTLITNELIDHLREKEGI